LFVCIVDAKTDKVQRERNKESIVALPINHGKLGRIVAHDGGLIKQFDYFLGGIILSFIRLLFG